MNACGRHFNGSRKGLAVYHNQRRLLHDTRREIGRLELIGDALGKAGEGWQRTLRCRERKLSDVLDKG